VKSIFSSRSYIILGGPLVSSLIVYFFLSGLLLFPSNIAVILTVISFLLLLGISSYLLLGRDEGRRKQNDFKHVRNNGDPDASADSTYHTEEYGDKKNTASNLIFISVYVISIIIVGTSKPLGDTGELFIAWNQLITTPTQLIHMAGAFLLTFFLPGYALVYILVKGNPLGYMPKILLSFLFSILIVAFSVYAVAVIIGAPMEYVIPIIISVDISILVVYIIYRKTKKTLSFNMDAIRSLSKLGPKFQKTITTENISLFVIFASIFSLVIFYTCYLEKGVIVGDQWFHHGKALLINSGTFKDFTTTDAGKYYPPFFSALLAGYFSLSGFPSVNAYVSLNVLNMMAIFGFYYFFTQWVPSNQRKVVVIATTLFVLSSGFGWVIVLDSSLTNSYHSQESYLENLHSASIRSSDIRTPTTFINVGHPTFTSPLIIIGLPAGFVLLGLIKELSPEQSRIKLICIITAITVLGILSHPEFYLFIIIGSILILSFRLSYGNLIYASILLALFFCLLVDFSSPQNYYTSIKILNVPLLILSLVFVSILWALFRTRILSKLYGLKSIRHCSSSTKHKYKTSKNAAKIVIISVLAYLYLFTFVVLETLSIDDIQLQVGTSTQRNIPWYLYPMKFGVVGLLGLAYIASYLFRRFEKEVFVFGIIAVVALIAGPYYDEHRFSKYIMVGMVGFASLLLYKIILYLQRPNDDSSQSRSKSYQLRPLGSSILIGLVITSSALSIFMLAGYKALGYNNPRFEEDFFRMDFPSQSELKLLNFFRTVLPNLNTHFISIYANDSQTEDLFSKLEGFSAVPRFRILQDPQGLKASTLEGLYYSLRNDNIKYIILTKSDANLEKQILKPLHFALDNFPRAYQDDTYIVLMVPDLVPAAKPQAINTGLVYDKINELPPLVTFSPNGNNSDINSSNILRYNYNFFNNIDNGSKFIKIENKVNGIGNKSKGEGTQTLILNGDQKPRTVWSSTIKESNKVNYVEGKFRLVAENKTRNDLGIKLEDKANNKQYYVSFDKDSLDLKQKPLEAKSNKEQVLAQNRQLPIEQGGLWHTLKILILKDTINVYLDDILKIKAPKSPFADNFSSISKVGIAANKNIGQFEPLKIGFLSESSFEAHQISNMKDTYFHYYYPLSALALSKLPYDTFINGDFSVLSRSNVMLTSDPKLELPGNETTAAEESGAQVNNVISKEKFISYLDFIKSGGTLIVMLPDSNSNSMNNYTNSTKSELGAFGKLLSLRYGDKVKFNGIFGGGEFNPLNKPPAPPILQHQSFINISGVATNIEFSNSSDVNVKSYYMQLDKDNKTNSKTVAPFTIEKKYGQGKVVLVNIAGYFDSLYDSKSQKFTTINAIPKLIGIGQGVHYVLPPKNTTIFTDARIIGDMEISNYTRISIKSNSLLFDSINGTALPYNFMIDKIITTANDNKHNESYQRQNSNEISTKNQSNVFSNITIKDLKLYGPYEVIINSSVPLFHMSPASSYYDYIETGIPKGFDMLLHLSQGAYAEFTIASCTNNSYCNQQIKIPNGDLAFHSIKTDAPNVQFLPVLLKSPEITINNGTAKINLDSNRNNTVQPVGNIVANGIIAANVDHADVYNSFNKNGTKTDIVTFLKSLYIKGNYMLENRESDTFRLPGDISVRAKDKGIGVPWETMLVSFSSIIIMISIIVVVIAVKYYVWPKIIAK